MLRVLGVAFLGTVAIMSTLTAIVLCGILLMLLHSVHPLLMLAAFIFMVCLWVTIVIKELV